LNSNESNSSGNVENKNDDEIARKQ